MKLGFKIIVTVANLLFCSMFITNTIVFLYSLINGVFGANILYISTMPARSHHIWNSALAISLNKQGHNVTILSHFDDKITQIDYTTILLEGLSLEDFDITAEVLARLNYFLVLKFFYDFSKTICEHVFNAAGLKALMNYPKDFKFDLVVFDVTSQYCLYPLIKRFQNPPVVAVTPYLLPPTTSYIFGNPLQPAYFPYFVTQYSDRMIFQERFLNFLYVYSEHLYRKYIVLPSEMALAKKYFGEDIQSFEDVERNISILLCNTDSNLEYPLDLPPNIISVGGLHVQPPKPLPEDLKVIVENAKNGIIVFSLGSIVKSNTISDSKKAVILNVLAKLSETVIWKFEDDNITNVPNNVIVKKWLPQSDLIAQPNVKLLINHGGTLSIQEAIYYGVPVVAIPFIADQFANSARLEYKKMGKMVDFKTITSDGLYSAIREVLDNPIFTKNIKAASKRYSDRKYAFGDGSLLGRIRITSWKCRTFKHRSSRYVFFSVVQLRSRSHHIWNRALALGLNKQGHNITLVSYFDDKIKQINYTTISLAGLSPFNVDEYTAEDLANSNHFLFVKFFYDFSGTICEYFFNATGLKTLMHYPNDFKFDLVVFDVTSQYCLYPLIKRFQNPPVVAVTPFLLPPIISYIFGNPLQPAYFPYFVTQYSDRMNFQERFLNFLYVYTEHLYRKYIALPSEMALAKKYFGGDIQSFEDVERNISILLCNTDSNLEYPLDLPPNIISVGGLHVQPPKPLPKDLKEIVENAKNGIIIFSLGSTVKSNTIGDSKRASILNALAKFSETVIWKFEDNITNLPNNVIVKKWLPQSDLIAQPNVKLLINHGGGLSTQEAIHHGVPVVAIPFVADQIANAARLENKKMGKAVDFKTITSDGLYSAIREVLDNSIYTKNIKAVSKRYSDRLNTPLETAVFWVEYTLRHGSAEHLNIAARDMYFFQWSNLDVIAVLILGIYLLYALLSLMVTVVVAILKKFYH
ncbi:hypothetical protein FQA39_LY04966 [Lamprigera yunnana]|nr:hypothetical protein FQA39_LY04966 [Lamprigera yunnana]